MTEQYPIPIDVRCPECSALEGQPCIRDGKSIRSAHWERVVLATNARMARHAAQTCSVCGAPWVRVVEHEPAYRRDVPGGTVVSPAISRTVGFRPSCEHEDVPLTTAWGLGEVEQAIAAAKILRLQEIVQRDEPVDPN